jgi:hypothetical protein
MAPAMALASAAADRVRLRAARTWRTCRAFATAASYRSSVRASALVSLPPARFFVRSSLARPRSLFVLARAAFGTPGAATRAAL